MHLRTITPKKPDTEMARRMLSTLQYLKYCEKYSIEVDWERVKLESVQAYAVGIVTGTCGADEVFELPYMSLNDDQFYVLIAALTTKSQCETGCPKRITFKFPDNHLTDKSLEAIAKAVKDDKFPEGVTIDLSGSNRFTDAGAKILLEALADERCNHSVEIKLPIGRCHIHPDLVQSINNQLQENRTQRRPVKQEKVKKDGFFPKVKRDKPKQNAAVKAKKKAASQRKSIFKSVIKKTKTTKDGGEKQPLVRKKSG